MKSSLTITQKITLAAMLIVIDILATRLPGLFQSGALFSFNRISLGPSIVIFSSLCLGPLFGSVVGMGGDILGWLILGQQTGALNIFVSLLYGMLGVLPWALSLLFRKIKAHKFDLYVLLSFLLALFGLLIVMLFPLGLFDSTLMDYWSFSEHDAYVIKVVFAVISGVLLLGLGVGLFFSQRYFQKRNSKLLNVESPIQVGFICTISEIILMVFYKPFAFWLYCLIFLGGSIEEKWGMSYPALVLISIPFSFIDIFISTFFVSWLLMFSKPFITHFDNKEKANAQ